MTGYVSTRWAWATGIATMFASTGCGDDVAPVEGCVQAVCDIYDAACVKATTEGVGCHLELATIAPRVRYAFAEEVIAEREAAAALSPEEEEERDDVLRGGALFGLMPPNYEPEDLVPDHVAQIAAYYDPNEDRITILRENLAPPGHRVLHARPRAGARVSRRRARPYRVRREVRDHARPVPRHAIRGRRRRDPPRLVDRGRGPEVDAGSRGGDEGDTGVRAGTVPSDGNALRRHDRRVPYGYGGAFVRTAWQEGGHGAVAELYGLPPDSVRQVVGGYDGWPDELVNAESELDGHDVPDLGDGYSLIHYSHQGIWMLNTMLQRATGATPWAEGPMGVGADALAVLREDATDELVLTWRIVASEEERVAISELLLATSTWALAEPGADPTRFIVTEVEGDLVLLATTPGLSPIEVFESIESWTAPATEEKETADMAAPASLTQDLLVYRRPSWRLRSL